MTRYILYLFCCLLFLPLSAVHAATNTPAAIPWNQIGAKAGADYQGDGLTITPTANGAQLHCIFQRLDAEATPQGLWLTSTVTNTTPGAPACSRLTTDTPSDHFRVTATAIGRAENAPSSERGSVPPDSREASWIAAALCRFSTDSTATSEYPYSSPAGEGRGEVAQSNYHLPPTGKVTIDNQLARYTRPNLTEEYTVSMDGLRQDFIVEAPPAGREASWTAAAPCRISPPSATPTALILTLSVTGARVEPAPDGARLILEHSGRQIAYTRLRVTDASGKPLPARIEVPPVGDEVTSLKPSDWLGDNFEIINPLCLPSADNSQISNPESRIPNLLSIVIDDSSALYPLRIDPTFSDANWVSMGALPGANYQVAAAVIDNSGNLFIGGRFTLVGNTYATNVAEWNGTNWSALGAGINFSATALAVSGSTLYASSGAGGAISQWNGTNWSSIGSVSFSEGLGFVEALAVSGGTLYVGGDFTNAGGIAANYVAQWNGTNWSALGSGLNGQVEALAVSGGTLYAGGFFTTAGGSNANNIAQWNGTNWSSLGSGTGGPVAALAMSGNTLYAGGFFTTAGGSNANYIAQWDGTNWSALGSGMNLGVFALAVSGNTLYAGGQFTTAGGSNANYIAQWNGTNWSGLGTGTGGMPAAWGTAYQYPYVYALAASGSALYAGGQFTVAGGSGADCIAQWNGANWSAIGGTGLNNQVYALAISGSSLYAGGQFYGAGNSANFIAQWNGTNWLPLGSGMSSNVLALAVSGNSLYAGGLFTNAGGIPAHYIAKWDGTNWSALGSGMNNEVEALAVSGSMLYAGGTFTTASGSNANYIAQWNGSSWSALGSGLSTAGGDGNGPYVKALACSGSTLYVAGEFAKAGGVLVNSIAEWNGSAWSALGSGMNGGVDALAVSGGTLYVAGGFSTAGGVAVQNIVQWNGSSWSALGSGLNDQVNALAVVGNTLYAAGYFTSAGGSPANCIAQWNGTGWSSLGSGLSTLEVAYYQPSASALAVSGSTLYVGGNFTTAGTNVSAFVAEALLPPPLSILTTDGNFGFTNGYFGFDISGPPGSDVVIQTSTDLQTWLPLQTNTLNSNGLLYFSDTQSPATAPRFYIVVLP